MLVKVRVMETGGNPMKKIIKIKEGAPKIICICHCQFSGSQPKQEEKEYSQESDSDVIATNATTKHALTVPSAYTILPEELPFSHQ